MRSAVMGPIVNVPSLYLTSSADTGSAELISSICRWMSVHICICVCCASVCVCLCVCMCVWERSFHSTSVFVDGVNKGERRLEGGSLCVCLCVIALNRSTERSDKPYGMRCFGQWWKRCIDLVTSKHISFYRKSFTISNLWQQSQRDGFKDDGSNRWMTWLVLNR